MYLMTAAEMREADRLTTERGLSAEILMENAGHRVVEFLAERFAPLSSHRILVLCGKGNNGGDGVVIARQLFGRLGCRGWALAVDEPPANTRGAEAAGVLLERRPPSEALPATLIVDAMLGTGLTGAPREPYASWIRALGSAYRDIPVVAVDIPSGLASDTSRTDWPHVRATATVTFTAPKPAHFLWPSASACGEVQVAQIGTPEELRQSGVRLIEPGLFRDLLAPRDPLGHKGTYGHALIIGGAEGKTGAVTMAGLAALRAGAGLVTVAGEGRIDIPELMSARLGDLTALEHKRVVAIGPGLGMSPGLVRAVLGAFRGPVVVDADGLNSLDGSEFLGDRLVLTPHPGEMARLTGYTVAEVEADRFGIASLYARRQGLCLVLKGRNSIVARPGSPLLVNTTGGPAMGTGGSGDILTGLIAGFLSQFPDRQEQAVAAAVWLHGKAGDLAAAELGEQCVIATDLLRFLPAAIKAARC